MSPAERAAVFYALFSVVLIWCGWLLFYRPYRADLLRHRLRMLADELFDHALAGRLPFDSLAYQRLRLLLDHAGEQAEQITLTRLLIALISSAPASWEELTAGLAADGLHAADMTLERTCRALACHALPGFALAAGTLRRAGGHRLWRIVSGCAGTF